MSHKKNLKSSKIGLIFFMWYIMGFFFGGLDMFLTAWRDFLMFKWMFFFWGLLFSESLNFLGCNTNRRSCWILDCVLWCHDKREQIIFICKGTEFILPLSNDVFIFLSFSSNLYVKPLRKWTFWSLVVICKCKSRNALHIRDSMFKKRKGFKAIYLQIFLCCYIETTHTSFL